MSQRNDPAATAPLRSATPPQGCQGQTKAGAPCQGIVQRDRPWCLAHDPDRQTDATMARGKGATTRNKLHALRGKRPRLDSAPALIGFVAGVVQDVLDGEVAPDIGRTVLYGISIQRSLIETSDLERRISELEAAEAQRQLRGGGKHPWQRMG